MLLEPTGNIWEKDSEKTTSIEMKRVFDLLKNQFPQWMQERYPELKSEMTCIKKDVVKKIEKKFRNGNVILHPEHLTKLFFEIAENECKLAIPTEKNLQKNLGLSRKAFKQQIRDLQNGDDSLIETVYLAHFEKCVSFLMRQCSSSYDDAHEASLNALLEIRQDLINEKIFYGNLAYYFTARAKVKLFKLNSKLKKSITSLDEADELEDDETIERDIHESEIKQLVAEGINKLCKNCKEILEQYYYEDKSFKEIAIKMQKSHSAIRQEARRCRNKLRTHLGESFNF